MYAEVCRGRSQVTAVSWPAWDARNLGTTEVTAMIAQVTWKDTDVSAKRIYSTKQHQESLAAPKWEQWRWIYYMSHWTSLNNTWSHCRSCDLASSEGLQGFLGELGGAAPRDQRAQWRPEPPDVRCNVFDSLNGIGISMILRSIHLPIIFLSVQCCNGTSSGSAMHPSRTEARQFRPPQARWCARKKNDMAHYASQFLIFFLKIYLSDSSNELYQIACAPVSWICLANLGRLLPTCWRIEGNVDGRQEYKTIILRSSGQQWPKAAVCFTTLYL